MPSVIVEYHPDTFDVFFTEPLKDFPTLAEDIKAEFLMYKSTGKLPPETFPEKLPQHDRTCNSRRDAALVYVRGELEENRYCLFGVLYPHAHAKARDEKMMRYLARLAQAFRDTH